MKRQKYILLQVCIDLSFILPPFLWVLWLFHFSHSIFGNKTLHALCMLLLSFWHSVFTSPPFSLHFLLHWTSLLLMLLCRASGSSLQKNKTAFPNYISSQLFPWKIQNVPLWRVAQHSWIFWSWFCLATLCMHARELSRQLQFTVSISKTSDAH